MDYLPELDASLNSQVLKPLTEAFATLDGFREWFMERVTEQLHAIARQQQPPTLRIWGADKAAEAEERAIVSAISNSLTQAARLEIKNGIPQGNIISRNARIWPAEDVRPIGRACLLLLVVHNELVGKSEEIHPVSESGRLKEVPTDLGIWNSWVMVKRAIHGPHIECEGTVVKIAAELRRVLAEFGRVAASESSNESETAGFGREPKVPQPRVTQEDPQLIAATANADAKTQLVSIYTGGLTDQRMEQATKVVGNESKSVNEKLTAIDDLYPFPPTASARDLAKLLGCTHPAIIASPWWQEHRAGNDEKKQRGREIAHQERAPKTESGR